MQRAETPLAGAFVLSLPCATDTRGSFSRLFCKESLVKAGLWDQESPLQISHSVNTKKATLRGMHYQLPPFGEIKLVYCLRGALHDVILDLRVDSPTFGQTFAVVLREGDHKMLYIPQGCAHGFITLTDQTEILYTIAAMHRKESERGVRWNDPHFRIAWPLMPEVISERDQNHPVFNLSYHLGVACR